LDHFVGVEKLEVKIFRDQPAHGRFPRAHETDEREVDGMPVILHDDGLTKKRRGRTPNSRARQAGKFG
jgi:hypothetical protein